MEKVETSREDMIGIRSDLQGLVREMNRLRTEDVRDIRAEVDGLRNNQGRTFMVSLLAATAGIVAVVTLLLTAGGAGG